MSASACGHPGLYADRLHACTLFVGVPRTIAVYDRLARLASTHGQFGTESRAVLAAAALTHRGSPWQMRGGVAQIRRPRRTHSRPDRVVWPAARDRRGRRSLTAELVGSSWSSACMMRLVAE